MKRKWAPLCAAVSMLVLAACAAPSPKVGKDTRIRENFGVVALTVQNNILDENLMSSFLFEWKSAWIEGVRKDGGTGSRRIELAARKEGMSDSIVFFAEVPPGTYSLEQLSSSRGVGTYYTLAFPAQEFRFTVKANRVTNLGTLVTAIMPTGGFTRDARILRGLLPSDVEMRDYLRGAFPTMFAQQGEEPFQTWVDPVAIGRTAEAAGRIRHFASGMNSPVRAKDGTYYAGAPMGMIWRRSAKGEWSPFDTGYAREITALAALADGSLFAAAEGGTVLHSTNRGETWKNLGPLPSYGNVLAVGEFAKGRLYAVVKEPKAVQLLLAERPEGPWQAGPAITGPLSGGMGSPAYIEARAIPAGSKVAVEVKSRSVKIYDSATGAWTALALEDVGMLHGFDDGTVYLGHKLPKPKPVRKPKRAKQDETPVEEPKEFTAGVLRKTIDGGVTWVDVANYDTATQSFSFFSPTLLLRKTNVPPGEHVLAYSTDGGKTWTDHAPEARRFLPMRGSADGERLMLFHGAGVSSSADKGKTWRSEKFIFPDYSKDKDK